jgi:hypothetical protein
MKTIYCQKCGADGQRVEAYCKRCGEWLPDIDALSRPGLLRKLTREEKIRKMRLLEMISAGLSLISVAVILAVLAGQNDKQFLFLAVICCSLVAIYQMVNFYLGYKLKPKTTENRAEKGNPIDAKTTGDVRMLGEADNNQFVEMPSVVENTTELLDAVPRVSKRTQ